METISDRIKTVRLQAAGKKLTQEEFGKRLGLSRAVVTNLEDAENRLREGVPDNIIRLIAATYNVNYLWLAEGEGPMMGEEDTDALVERCMPNETEWAKSIMKAFCRLPDEEWVKFRDLIEEIKKRGRS